MRHLYERYRTVIAGARNRLAGKVIRFGTMGEIRSDDILTDLIHLEETLAALGHRGIELSFDIYEMTEEDRVTGA